MSKDYYNILGVDKGATQDELKKAFRKKAHEYHPDKENGDEAKFKEVNEAYQVLGDENKRTQFDQYGTTFDQQGGFGGGMGWDDFMRQARGGQYSGGFGGVEFDLGDLFSGMFGGGFGGGRGAKRSRRGGDLQIALDLSFREAIFGTEKEVEISKLRACETCTGSGVKPGSKMSTCSTCKGQGQVTTVSRTVFGNIQQAQTCPDCQGSGQKPDAHCVDCQGQGRKKSTETIKITLPAGIDDRMTIKMDGKGEAGIQGSPLGDLYVTIRVEGDDTFKREGDTIIISKEIPFSLAALGGKIDVETLDGKGSLKIPSGTRHGEIFKIRGKGSHRLRGSGRGDQLVEIQIAVPQKLSKEQKKILQELEGEEL